MKTLHYFKALADTTRIRLVNTLISHELSVNEIVTLFGMGQSRISRHLKILTDAGILQCRRDGVWAFYSISDQQEPRRLTDAIRFLFDAEPDLKKDLAGASAIIEDRNVKTRRFFNSIASDWDLLKKEILGGFDLNQAILQKVSRSRSAVDLGCGTGELIQYLVQKSARVIGVDSSARMLEEARKRLAAVNGTADLRLGEIEHLPLRDGEVDVAVVSMVLHHISAPATALVEINRTLTPEGTLIIADLKKHANETLRHDYGDRWLGFGIDEVRTFLKAAGFHLTGHETHHIGQNLAINIFTSVKQETPYKNKEKQHD